MQQQLFKNNDCLTFKLPIKPKYFPYRDTPALQVYREHWTYHECLERDGTIKYQYCLDQKKIIHS